MNVLFMTQSGTLELFYDVADALSKSVPLEKVGFYISDSQFYDSFKRKHPELTNGPYVLLKEWDIIHKSKDITPDIERLRRYEKNYGDPYLWNALVADRRIYLGSTATLQQDYASRFEHIRMLSILQVAIDELEALFDRVRPDLVVGFICVTIGDYLANLVAKSRNIKFLNLRPTRVENFFYAGENVLEPSLCFEKAYREMLNNGIPEEIEQRAAKYLQKVRQSHAMYEGVVPAESVVCNKPAGEKRTAIQNFSKKIHAIIELGKQTYQYNFGEYKYDNSHRGVFFPRWFSRIKRPIRIRLTNLSLKRHVIHKQELEKLDYAFFPLHKEPEVTLLVYSRPYLNQIEVIRNIARSLPVGMKLLVKEHPACIGYRPLKYYQKLLDIPNVVLVPPETDSRSLVQHAALVCIISGSIGLEALMMKKPVVHFGHVPFEALPDGMIRRVVDPDQTAEVIGGMLRQHRHDESALMAYIAAVMDLSVPVDFYSVLLGKQGVYRPEPDKYGNSRTTEIRKLASYLLTTIDHHM